VDRTRRGPDWMKITPVAGSLFHERTHVALQGRSKELVGLRYEKLQVLVERSVIGVREQDHAGAYDPPEHLWLAVHFSPSPSGRAAGFAFLKRKLLRKDRGPEVSEEAAMAQREAITKYYAPAESVLDYLKDIRQPTLIVQGSNDVIIPTVNSYLLQQNLPNAQLKISADLLVDMSAPRGPAPTRMSRRTRSGAWAVIS
jgi:pimeloyl-ACP methyl ester carboxylesterase